MNKLTKKVIFLMVFLSILALLICGATSGAGLEQNYTNDSDFDNGALVGLEHNSTPNQLQLTNSSQSAFPYIWVPNSNQGTVSKVSTTTGLELARYRTSPSSSASSASPSRTTIDLDGGCWVGNRGTGTVIKIGLLENGGFYDRNHNGIIETSRDLDGNGVIEGIELLDWGLDECVLWEVVVIPGQEDTYRPGEYVGSYSNAPGPRGIAVDRDNNVWAGTYGTHRFYYINGTTGDILRNIDVSSVGHSSYGAVIDQNGILWSAGSTGNNVLRLDPKNNSFTRINIGHCAYGMGIDRNNRLFVSGGQHSWLTRINILTGTIDWRKPAVPGSGVAVTDDGDVWIANHDAGTVTRYTNNGDFKATIIIGNTPKGVSVDNNGKIWVVDYGDEYIHRINPNNNQTNSEGDIINGVELSKRIIGGTHYGYSDMTGSVSSTITTNHGTWTFVHDSGHANIPWGIINWNGSEPAGTSIRVRVRGSDDQETWSNWEEATNRGIISLTPAGRYLQVEVTLNRFLGNQTPILYDLTVTALVADIKLNMTVDRPSPRVGEEVTFTINATNTGPREATGLNINVNIPPGFNVSSVSHGLFQNGEWNIGNLSSGETAILTIAGLVDPPMVHQLITCNALKTHQDQYDPNTPDSASASFYSAMADLEVNNTVNSGTLDVGKHAIFTTTVRNNGPDPARDLRVLKPLPTGFTSPPPSLGTYQGGVWIIPFLASGANTTLTFIGQVTQDMAHNTITDTTRVIQQEYDPTPVSQVNSSFYVPLVDLEITNTAHRNPIAVGGVALSTITVRNLGPDTARGVVVRDPLPEGFIPGTPSMGMLVDGWWLVGDLASGQSAILMVGRPVAAAFSMTSAAAGYLRSYDPNPLNNHPFLTINALERAIVNPEDPGSPFSSVTQPLGVRAQTDATEKTIPMQETGMPLNLPSLALLLTFLAAYLNRNGAKCNKPLVILLVLVAIFLCCGVVGAADGYNYTNNDDFDQGTLDGVEHDYAHHQLQLPPEEQVDYIWVPNSNQGTVSKVNTRTGAEVARYRVNPRTDEFTFTAIVDKDGNCWAANSRSGTVVKIGLLEKNQYTDRNHNGIIDTSRDLDHNGVITGTELLAWGEDECVLFETILIPGTEGTFTPGTYTGSYGGYNYGVRSLAVDSDNNLWAGNYNTRVYYYINGTNGQIIRSLNLTGVNHNSYTLLIDRNGILWSGGNNLLRLDPSTDSVAVTNLGYFVYSLSLDCDEHLFSYGSTSGWSRVSRLSRINTTTGALDWTQNLPFSDVAGVTITPDGDVWISEFTSGWGWRRDYVKRFSHEGVLKATIQPGYRPNGLSVDSEGKVWVVDYDDEYIHRINPAINGVDLSKRIVGGRHYTTSSMTGTSTISNYFKEGTWNIIYDTNQINTPWGMISWTSTEPPGTTIRVQARSSNDQLSWSTWEDATNTTLLHLTPAGRYLQVIVTLTSTVKNVSPVLYDLTIISLSEAPINNADLGLTILTPTTEPTVNGTVRIVLHAGNNGPYDATSVHVNYRLPFGLEYQSTNGNYNPSTGLWTVGNLAQGTTTTLEIIARVINSGSLVNTGTITGTVFDPNATNNQATFTITVPNPAVEEQLPEVPGNLPVNGAATLPPIPNIEERMNLDPNDPKPEPGPGPDQKPQDEGPSPPSPLYTPKTQLQRDVAGIRQAVQSDSFKDQMNRPFIPDWNPQPDNDTDNPDSDNKVNEEWRSVLLKFAGDVIFFAAFALIPNEYLKGVGNSLLNSFETLGTIAKYFGYGKQVKQIADLIQRSKGVLLNPYYGSFISKWSILMDVLDFNVATKLLQWALLKIFPDAATEIKLMFAVISTANFALDPFGTLKTIVNLACIMFTKNIPNPEDLIKVI